MHDALLQPRTEGRLVILGTGGTIAGTAQRTDDLVGYTAGQRSIQSLLGDALGPASLPPGIGIEAEQLAQIDSKDMDATVWARLAQRIAHHLERAEVTGVVVTHGTDTMEETAWLLHRVLAPSKPVVLTGAMRPATAQGADGPANLIDALAAARTPAVAGVHAVMAGAVVHAADLRKRHPYRLDAVGAGALGEASPVARVEQGGLRWLRAPVPPATQALGVGMLDEQLSSWPWVEVLSSHALARPEGLQALLEAGLQGLVLQGTGNGTWHQALSPALELARARGVPVWRVTRCGDGALVGEDAGPAAGLSPWVARVELMLRLKAGLPV